MKNSFFKILSAAFAALVLSAACSKTDLPQQAQKGGHVENLVIGTNLAQQNDFSSQRQRPDALQYNALTQAHFVYTDKNGKIHPYFFKSFSISKDAKQLVFTFPSTAVWHDGKPVTKDDILFTFDFMKNVRKTGSLKNLEKWEITGENECTLTFSEPDAYYWINNAVLSAFVFPKHVWEGVEDYRQYNGKDAALGCGPYRLVSLDKDSQTSVYEAVPQNAFLGELTVDKITVQTYSGEDTLMFAMANGEIDAMFNYANSVDVTVIDSFKGTDGIDFGESDYAGNYQVTYGMERKPCTDIAFRKACRLAFDYGKLAAVINGSYGTAPGAGIIPPSCKGFDPSLPILKTDIKEAARLLDEAGYKDINGDGFREYPDGSELKVMVTQQFSTRNKELFNRMSDVIMASLKNIGVKTYVDEESLRNDEVWEQNIIDGNYDISIGYTTSGMAQYTSAFRYFLADPRFEGENTWIWGTFHNDEFKDTFFAMQRASDDETYIKNVRKLQAMANDVAFAQALCWEKCFFPYRTDKYEGWDNYPSWGVIHPTTWFELRTIKK